MDTLNELVALRSTAGHGNFYTGDADLVAALDGLEVGDAEAAEAWALAHPRNIIDCRVRIHGNKAHNPIHEVELVLCIPSDYPEAAVTCHAQSCQLPRHWVDSCTSALRHHANESSRMFAPCLYELFQLVHDTLNDAQELNHGVSNHIQHQDDASSTQPASQRDADTAAEMHACLLQLDHMRNKAGYIKTIRKWTAQLGLTGRLIFFRQFIWIYLEGSKSSIKEYITLQRTVSVDVDSKGRKCKERMMDVLCEAPLQTATYADFREVEVDCLDEALVLVRESGMDTQLRISSGL